MDDTELHRERILRHVSPIITGRFLGFQASQYGEASALAVTSLVPSIVLGMLVQRHLVRGLTLGAVQG